MKIGTGVIYFTLGRFYKCKFFNYLGSPAETNIVDELNQITSLHACKIVENRSSHIIDNSLSYQNGGHGFSNIKKLVVSNNDNRQKDYDDYEDYYYNVRQSFERETAEQRSIKKNEIIQ